jgi:CRISPR-associated protein Csx17
MNAIVLAGCRADSLLGYLKAIGTLRLVAEQADRSARASWNDMTFVLHTSLDEKQLQEFFLEYYAPTPIFNPWNNGAGFDGPLDERDRASSLIGRVRATRTPRWSLYREVLDCVFENFVETGDRSVLLGSKRKDELLRQLRLRIPEAGLPWLDAAVSVRADGASYPFILGSGGNDGRLDFSINFVERALELVGPQPSPQARAWLSDSLFETSEAKLVAGAAIGQFSGRHTGGANASAGFTSDSLVNPWDYVLLIEGCVAFRGAVVRRLGSRHSRSSFPFAFRGSPSGFGSGSDEEKPRGEVWLPLWSGIAGYRAVADAFRRGRIDLPSDGGKSQVVEAVAADQAAVAVATLGVTMGIESFRRFSFVPRNGLAYTAVPAGVVEARESRDKVVATISMAAAVWIGQVRGNVVAGNAGIRDLLRHFDETLFALTAETSDASQDDRNERRRELLYTLASIEYQVSRRAPEFPKPLRELSATLAETLFSGTPEGRIAAALASLGSGSLHTALRLDMEPVKVGDSGHGLEYDRGREPRLGIDFERSLAEICERRFRKDENEGSRDPHRKAQWTGASRGAHLADIAEMLSYEGDGGWKSRLRRAMIACSIVAAPRHQVDPVGHKADQSGLPASYAAMKVVMDDPLARDSRIVSLLRANDADRAIAISMRRARALVNERLLGRRIRDITGSRVANPRWLAAALLVPVASCCQQELFNTATIGESHR